MAKERLVWDADGTRLYETGTRNAVLYVRDAQGKYRPGVAWNGITGMTETPAGADATDLYADDIKYLTMRAAETFGATITAYTYPDEFAECDGSATPVKGMHIGQQTRKTFGVVYRSVVGNDAQGEDYGYKLHLWYGCTCSPSERAYSTINDSPEAIEFSWEVSTIPVNVQTDDDQTYKATACVTIDSIGAGEHLKDLEDILFGSAEYEPELIDPSTVIKVLKEGKTAYTQDP